MKLEPGKRLGGRVAAVTGGAGGLGAAICRAFADEGAAVAVCDAKLDAARAVAEEITTAGGKAGAWGFDVTDKSAVEQAAESIEDSLGPLEIWVNNAGISIIVPFLDCPEKVWDQTLAVNLKGAYLGCQAAIRRMLRRGRGSIINMSSQSGKTGNSHYAAYCASKFGVIGLTQSTAVEFASSGIRVNAICPGVVFTALWDGMIDDYAAKRNMRRDEVKPYLESKVPMGRLCSPKDVARTAVFLASDESAYVTGQALNLTGGGVMH
jgi:NAD(P)-dependent dehydrogenase (short-subunit alcohol dehydrogenase family)